MVRSTYDGSGRLATVEDRQNDAGHRTTFGYDRTSARLASITDANGHVAVSMTYDSQRRVQNQWTAQGSSTSGHRTEFS